MSDQAEDPKRTALVPRREFTLLPASLGEAQQLANIIANSEFAPRDYKGKPDSVLIAVQMGADIGLKPMQALQNIAVINGRPSIYGDAALALVMPDLEKFKEFFEGEKGTDSWTAVCVSKRKGWPDETITKFSVLDAKRANLWGKTGPWTQYPDRMQMFRARGFNLRTVGADRLLGLVLAEEAQDYPAIEGTVISSEVVATDPLDGVSDELREKIQKGVAELSLSPAQLLVQINKVFTGDRTKDEAATLLLDWMRDEFSKRKSGKPRVKKDGDNGKNAGTGGGSAPPAAGASTQPAERPAGTGGSDPHQQAAPATPAVVAAEASPVATTRATEPVKAAKDELF
jgi:hypothetical protein